MMGLETRDELFEMLKYSFLTSEIFVKCTKKTNVHIREEKKIVFCGSVSSNIFAEDTSPRVLIKHRHKRRLKSLLFSYTIGRLKLTAAKKKKKWCGRKWRNEEVKKKWKS